MVSSIPVSPQRNHLLLEVAVIWFEGKDVPSNDLICILVESFLPIGLGAYLLPMDRIEMFVSIPISIKRCQIGLRNSRHSASNPFISVAIPSSTSQGSCTNFL